MIDQSMDIERFQSGAVDQDSDGIVLSIVVPFFQYNVLPLLSDLCQKIAPHSQSVEIIFLDDGSPSRAYTDALIEKIQIYPTTHILVARSAVNLGRSRARNMLATLARGEYLIYLDCDMLPDNDDYIERYLVEIAKGVVLAYGGRSTKRCSLVKPEHYFHWYFTNRFERVDASIRRSHPAFYFLSSNFLVRKNIVNEFPLDDRFAGWGWEDCEWVHRVSFKYELEHIDNPATHLGLIAIPDIKRKYQESVKNFQLILSSCPELVRDSSLYRFARGINSLRIAPLVLWASDKLMSWNSLPLAVRVRFLQIYKAALYASVVNCIPD